MRRVPLLLLPLVLALGACGGGGGGGGGEGSGSGASAGPTDGRTAFVESCGGCHTFAPAGTDGQQGPALDGTSLDAERVAGIVRGGLGQMPAFGGELEEPQIAAIAEYVSSGG